jgi:hypothetical protein
MSYNTKRKILIGALAAFALAMLTGCSSTVIKDSSLQKRTVSLNILGIVQFEKTTEGLAIGDATLTKEEESQPTE